MSICTVYNPINMSKEESWYSLERLLSAKFRAGDGGGDDIDYDEDEGDAPVLVVIRKTYRGHYFCRQEGNSSADEVVH